MGAPGEELSVDEERRPLAWVVARGGTKGKGILERGGLGNPGTRESGNVSPGKATSLSYLEAREGRGRRSLARRGHWRGVSLRGPPVWNGCSAGGASGLGPEAGVGHRSLSRTRLPAGSPEVLRVARFSWGRAYSPRPDVMCSLRKSGCCKQAELSLQHIYRSLDSARPQGKVTSPH
jgi:hypothetical protein